MIGYFADTSLALLATYRDFIGRMANKIFACS